MGKSVFISYSHQQGEWVWNALVPCLRAGGAEVHLDIERFRAGKEVVAQMDKEQDDCDLSVLVLSPEYLASKMCQHEMQRALVCNKLVAVLRADCAVPDEIGKTLYVDLRNDKAADKWDLLMRACEADLGATATDWLQARDEIVRYLQRGDSVNLVVTHKPKWRELITHLKQDHLSELGIVDLQNPSTASRRGLVVEMLKACGSFIPVPPEPEDLVTLGQVFERRLSPTQIALIDFDMVAHRRQYEVDFFSSLRYLITVNRKLILLIQSRNPFIKLLPADHPLSSITDLKTVELKGRP